MNEQTINKGPGGGNQSQQSKPTAPVAAPAPRDPNRIPVARLTLRNPGGPDLFRSTALPSELRTGMSTILAGETKSGARFEIHFLPQWHVLRVALIFKSTAPPEVVMVPADACYWSPAEE